MMTFRQADALFERLEAENKAGKQGVALQVIEVWDRAIPLEERVPSFAVYVSHPVNGHWITVDSSMVGAAFRLTEEGPIEVGEDWPEWACCGVRALNDSWHSTSCPYVATQEAIRQARTIAALPEEETEK